MRKPFLFCALIAALLLALPYAARAVEGNFLINCQPDGIRIADPIGGATHPHAFACGHVGSDLTTPFDLLTGPTTGQVGLETAAYWHPAVQKPDGTLVQPHHWSIYYRNPDASTPSVPLPFGMKHVHGNPANTNPNTYGAVYRCSGSGNTSVYLPATCASGNGFEETMFFSGCWDGSTLDGPGHKSLGPCDAQHPIKSVFVNLIITWTQEAVGGKLTSDIEHGTAPGLTSHADGWFTFDPIAFPKVVERCLNRGIQCRVGNGVGPPAGSIYQFGTQNVILTAAEAAGAF